MKNLKCPSCGSHIIRNFDKLGAIKNECVNKECGYEFYDNEDMKFQKEKRAKELKIAKMKAMMEDDSELILISNLKNIREKHNFSQKTIADVLEVTEQRLGSIERNINTPTVIVAARIARILGVSLNDVYKEVLLPREVFDQIKYLDLELNYNENLAKNDCEYMNAKKEVKQINAKVNSLNKDLKDVRKKITAKKNTESTSSDLEALYELKESIENDIDDLEFQLQELSRKVDFYCKAIQKDKKRMILKQFSIIEMENWKLVKEKFNLENIDD